MCILISLSRRLEQFLDLEFLGQFPSFCHDPNSNLRRRVRKGLAGATRKRLALAPGFSNTSRLKDCDICPSGSVRLKCAARAFSAPDFPLRRVLLNALTIVIGTRERQPKSPSSLLRLLGLTTPCPKLPSIPLSGSGGVRADWACRDRSGQKRSTRYFTVHLGSSR